MSTLDISYSFKFIYFRSDSSGLYQLIYYKDDPTFHYSPRITATFAVSLLCLYEVNFCLIATIQIHNGLFAFCKFGLTNNCTDQFFIIKVIFFRKKLDKYQLNTPVSSSSSCNLISCCCHISTESILHFYPSLLSTRDIWIVIQSSGQTFG